MATCSFSQSTFIRPKPSLPPKALTNLSRVSFYLSNTAHAAPSPLAKQTKLAPKLPLTVPEASISPVFSDKKATNPIVVIDNYDSFTYNLCQYMGELGCNFEVYRNDELTVDELKRKNPRGILISPGPGTPQDSGISLQTVFELGPTIPLFGVCMGLQCIGKVVRSPHGVMHGKSSLVYYNEGGEDGLFTGLSNPFTAGRYHSLVIEKDSFPSEVLEITAWTEDGLVMAARHKIHRHLLGVQFHPESIITTEGRKIVRNFVTLIERLEAETPT
ncbi:hypothetical protein RJ640_005393 [Escallonia rubra]|uniref:anthranilate synthase n=1 Tax=Escallonia rubra TaxID=112253 RepID=A0AA88UKJ4_9ASTE|nr:hypothetical protein RJ640_005393 [Escallonia rubra]